MTAWGINVHVSGEMKDGLIRFLHDLQPWWIRLLLWSDWNEVRSFIQALPLSTAVVGVIPTLAVVAGHTRDYIQNLRDEVGIFEIGNELELELQGDPNGGWTYDRIAGFVADVIRRDVVPLLESQRYYLWPAVSSTPAGRLLLRHYARAGGDLWPGRAVNIHVYGRYRQIFLWHLIRTDVPDFAALPECHGRPVWITETGVRGPSRHVRWWEKVKEDVVRYGLQVERAAWYVAMHPATSPDAGYALAVWRDGQIRIQSPLVREWA